MPALQLDPASTALVLIDLQNGILGLPLAPYSAEHMIERSNQLIQSCRRAGIPVMFVHVLLSELRYPTADKLSFDPTATPPASASELSPKLDRQPADLVITKRQWGAFYGTDLDLQLRRRGVRTIILCGITTNFGVESTARAAFDQGYGLIFAEDTTTSVDVQAHQSAIMGVFPYMGKVRKTSEIVEALEA